MEDDEVPHIVEVQDPEDANGIVEVPIYPSSGVEAVTDFLKDSNATYEIWMQTALFFLSHNMIDKYSDILEIAADLIRKSVPKRDYRVNLLCSLAGHYLSTAGDDGGDKIAMTKFERTLKEGKRCDPTHPWLRILEASYEIVKGADIRDNLQKEKHFLTSLNSLEVLKPACKTMTHRIQLSMSIAVCKYKLEDFVGAWKEFADVVARTPAGDTPNGARLGLAYCNFKLGQEESAISCFRRAVDEDPNCVRALLGLAGILLGYQGTDAVDRHKEGFSMLLRAYRADDKNPLLLNMFASTMFRQYFVTKEDKHRKTIKGLVRRVLDHIPDEKIEYFGDLIAEAYYQGARVHHASSEFDKAYTEYTHALKHNPKHLLAMYSRAQCLIYSKLVSHGQEQVNLKDVELVLKDLDACFRLAPDNLDLLKLTSKLNSWKFMSVRDAKEKEAALQNALEHLQKITDLANPEDREAWSLRGYLERLDPMSLSYFEEQVNTIKNAGKPIPASLLNNLAAMYIHSKKQDRAAATLREAQERLAIEKNAAISSNADQKTLQALDVTSTTLHYNSAIFEERRKNPHAAVAKHLEVIKTWPTFMDSYIALVDLLHQLGQSKKAVSLAELARTVAKGMGKDLASTAGPRLQLATVLGKIGQWKAARKHAQEVVEILKDSKDPEMMDLQSMAMLIQANGIFLEAAKSSSSKSTELLQQSELLFKEVYGRDRNNAFAAHNLACCIASRNNHMVDFSQHILERVKEANVPGGDDLDYVASYNIAQCHFIQRTPSSAIPLYHSLIEKLEQDPSMESILPIEEMPSKLAHCQALTTDFRSAVRGFTRASSNNPQSIVKSTNLALCALGSVVQDFTDDKLTSLDDIRVALGQIHTARSTFHRLSTELSDAASTPEGRRDVISQDRIAKLQNFISVCKNVESLLEDEKSAIILESKHAEKGAVEFTKSREGLTQKIERSAIQKEVKRQQAIEDKRRRMDEQEQKFREIQDAMERRNDLPDITEARPKKILEDEEAGDGMEDVEEGPAPDAILDQFTDFEDEFDVAPQAQPATKTVSEEPTSDRFTRRARARKQLSASEREAILREFSDDDDDAVCFVHLVLQTKKMGRWVLIPLEVDIIEANSFLLTLHNNSNRTFQTTSLRTQTMTTSVRVKTTKAAMKKVEPKRKNERSA